MQDWQQREEGCPSSLCCLLPGLQQCSNPMGHWVCPVQGSKSHLPLCQPPGAAGTAAGHGRESMDGIITLGRRLGIPYPQGGGEATNHLLYHGAGGRSRRVPCPLFEGRGVPSCLPRAPAPAHACSSPFFWQLPASTRGSSSPSGSRG